jgi:hypothetical protein
MNINKKLIITLITVGSLILLGIIVRATFFTFVDNYEYAYEFNMSTGKTRALLNKDGSPQHGYFTVIPFYKVIHTIDMRPMQVCINANSRVLNCKLVEFNPDGLETFIAWHGRGDYSGGQLEDILKSYAYDPSNKSYPFMIIKKELKNEDFDYENISTKQDTVYTKTKDTVNVKVSK